VRRHHRIPLLDMPELLRNGDYHVGAGVETLPLAFAVLVEVPADVPRTYFSPSDPLLFVLSSCTRRRRWCRHWHWGSH
jgi:hypothetical protein